MARLTLAGAVFLVSRALDARSADLSPVPEYAIARAAGPIVVDGELSDEGWRDAAKVETWFETNPGDNVPPRVACVGYLTYDDRFFYVGLSFEDPEPSRIRAPLGDRDNMPGSTDYGGVILDTRNDGRTGMMFLANARGIQYDAISDDAGGGEDSSPDFFWDAAGHITDRGWSLEIRIPFSSLRYPKRDPQTWGVMLYRNYPREFRYQMFSTRHPRGGNCFICRSNKLTGLSGLPSGSHLVLAPYASGSRKGEPEGELGTPLRDGPISGEVGLDVKWTPSAAMAVDATLNPDFSQIESDVAQIAANERFALFFPEKRPFFLEGIELFSTPIQAVYTRTITSPRFGVRATGKVGSLAYTGLFAEDRGGGSVVLPGPDGSDLALQDFRSFVAVARVRRDLGRSFVSVLASAREAEGDTYNRVFGPDVQWRPSDRDTVTGQLLFSFSRTPDRPDLAEEWDGRALSSHAAHVWWSRSTPTYDWFAEARDIGEEFRADNGFVPQAGFREAFLDTGYTFRPKGAVRRLRIYVIADHATDHEGDLLNRQLSVGFGLDALWASFARIRYAWDRVRAGLGSVTLPRQRLIYTLSTNPSRLFSQLSLDGFLGGEIDFANARAGSGGNVTLGATLRPTDHLELRFNDGRRWLSVDGPGGGHARLFTAKVDRVRATYTFTSRAFLRAIAQYVSTHRDPSLYGGSAPRRSASFSGSVLLAYKVNWQTVVFVGYGDNRALSEEETLERADRQLFVKLSYALQR